MGVSSSPSHVLHVPVSALPSVCRCLIRLQCPVSSPTASLMSAFLVSSSWSMIFLSGPLMSAFVCLMPGAHLNRLLCRPSIHSATSVFTWQPATPTAGSGLWSGVPNPLLASSSATSTYRYGPLNRWLKCESAIERERRAWSATYFLLFEGDWRRISLKIILQQSLLNRRT